MASKSKTTEQFIEQARQKHGDRYDYSLTVYKNARTPVVISCPVHGPFEQLPNSHLKYGCNKCKYESFKLPFTEFVKQATALHGDQYDYSQVEWKGRSTKITITCRKCNKTFSQLPDSHLRGHGCTCINKRPNPKARKTTSEFIVQAKEKFGTLYGYEHTQYVKAGMRVTVTCPIHGDVLVDPTAFIHRSTIGCPKCGREYLNDLIRNYWDERKISLDDFVIRSRMIHGDKYDYSRVNIAAKNGIVIIGCPEHGFYRQSYKNHLRGRGCIHCSKQVRNKGTQNFIREAIKHYGKVFDYSITEYVNAHTPIKFICPKHGVKEQDPTVHLTSVFGCNECAQEYVASCHRISKDEFIEKATVFHGGKYDYSGISFTDGTHDVANIICPKHGPFTQNAWAHMNVSGCPACKESSGERDVRNTLIREHIEFVAQKRFDWLIYKRGMSLDFYLPQYNLAIECQGEQHFGIVKGIYKKYYPDDTAIQRDTIKYSQCKEHGIRIIYYTKHPESVPSTYFDVITSDVNELVEIIKTYNNKS